MAKKTKDATIAAESPAASPKAPSKAKAPKVKTVEVKERVAADLVNQNRNDHLVTINGHSRMLTRMAIETAVQRGDDVELPKGSRITLPDYLSEKANCGNCGS